MNTGNCVYQYTYYSLFTDITLRSGFMKDLDFHGISLSHNDMIRGSVEDHFYGLVGYAFRGKNGSKVISSNSQHVFIID